MRKTRRAALAIILCIAGLAVAYLDALYLTDPWSQIEFHDTVSIWLSTVDLHDLAGFWSIVWLYLPEWTISFIVGLVLGLFARAKSLILYALSFCVGFVLIPQFPYVDREMWVFGTTVIVGTFIWNSLCFPIAVLGGALPMRRAIYGPGSRRFRFSVTRLLLVTLCFAAMFFAITNSRLIVLPCLFLGFLTLLACTTIRRRLETEVALDPVTTENAEP